MSEPSLTNIIRAHKPGDPSSLRALAVAIAERVRDTPPLPQDPVELEDTVDTQGAELAGTWQEVRAARDHGDLTPGEYDYLAAAVGAMKGDDDAE